MRVSDLDPSMTIAYYFRDREDFNAFCVNYQHRGSSRPSTNDTSAVVADNPLSNDVVKQPLFSVEHAPPSVDALGDFDEDSHGGRDGDGDIEDEYVMI